jgi:hypothetical protein
MKQESAKNNAFCVIFCIEWWEVCENNVFYVILLLCTSADVGRPQMCRYKKAAHCSCSMSEWGHKVFHMKHSAPISTYWRAISKREIAASDFTNRTRTKEKELYEGYYSIVSEKV